LRGDGFFRGLTREREGTKIASFCPLVFRIMSGWSLKMVLPRMGVLFSLSKGLTINLLQSHSQKLRKRDAKAKKTHGES